MQLSFSIPQDTVLIAKKGDAIKIGDPLFNLQSTDVISYDIARMLSIKPDAVFSYLSIVVGQEVAPGTILAEKKALIGSKKAQSDVLGVVDRIQVDTGEIIVRHGTKASGATKTAWFTGMLTEIGNDKKSFTVTFKDATQLKLKSVNLDGGGELFTMNDKDFFSIGVDEIGHKVILLEHPQPHILSKLDALDAGGCISAENIPNSDVPSAVTATQKDFVELLHSKKKYCAFSLLDMKAVLY